MSSRAFPASLLMRYINSDTRTKQIDAFINVIAQAAIKLSRAEAERHKVTQACLVPSSSDPACLCNGVFKLHNEAIARVSKAGKMLDDALTARASKMARDKRTAAKKKA